MKNLRHIWNLAALAAVSAIFAGSVAWTYLTAADAAGQLNALERMQQARAHALDEAAR